MIHIILLCFMQMKKIAMVSAVFMWQAKSVTIHRGNFLTEQFRHVGSIIIVKLANCEYKK